MNFTPKMLKNSDFFAYLLHDNNNNYYHPCTTRYSVIFKRYKIKNLPPHSNQITLTEIADIPRNINHTVDLRKIFRTYRRIYL